MPGGEVSDILQEGGVLKREDASVSSVGLDDQRGDVMVAFEDSSDLPGGHRRHDCVVRYGCGNAAPRLAGLRYHVVVPAVELPLELQYLPLARVGPRQSQSEVGGLRSGAGEPHPLQRRHQVLHRPCVADLVSGVSAQVGPRVQLRHDGCLDRRRVVSH